MHKNITYTKGLIRDLTGSRRIVAGILIVSMILVQQGASASTWKPTALVNTEAFQSIDDADSTANVVLKFGDTLAKTLTYNRTSTRFEFNDSVYVTGDIGTSGSLSGASIYGLGLASCSNTTNDKLLYNSATGRFSCGSDQTGGGGLDQTSADERYVKKQGDTMTGALTLDITTSQTTSGALTLLQRTHATGAFIDSDTDREPALAIDIVGTSIAPHILFGYQGNFDTNLYRPSADTLKTNDSLEVDGNLTFGDAISDTVTANASVWTFVNDTNFVLSGGVNGLSFDTDTFSVDAGNNRIGIGTTAPDTTLEVVGTMSGSTVYAQNSLRSSGSLVFEGAASGSSLYLGTSLQGAGLTSCSNTTTSKLLYDSSTGRFSCGTDQTGGGGGLDQTSADERYVKKQGDTMTGALTLDITTSQTTSGALTLLQRTHATGAFINSDTDRAPALAIDIVGTSAAPHIQFGYQGYFDTNLFRSAADTLKTNDSLEVDGNLTFGDAISDAITVNASTWTFANDTDFVLSGGVNGLSFDSGTFSVDALNNRIGINTTAPDTRLEVVGTISGSLIRAGNMTVSGAVVYSSGNTLSQTAKGLSGQLLLSQGTSAPKWGTPSGGMIWYFDGNQAIATSKGPEITMPIALTLSGISLKAKGAPTGAALIYDINKDGVSIFSTRPQIDAAATTGGDNAVLSTTLLPVDSVLTIDIDQVGSTFAGSGVTIILKGTRKY